MRKKTKLSLKQRKFVEQYLLTGNATKSAIAAGYSKASASSIGEENLRKPEIKQELEKHHERRKVEFEVDEKRIIQELASIAFFNLKSVMRPEGRGVSLKSWKEIPDEVSKAIASVSESENQMGSSQSIRSFDKIGALKLLGQHIGMWKDGPKQKSDSNPLDIINQRLLARIQKRTDGGGSGGGQDSSTS
jgi:phage terminase small subunit